MDRGAWQATVHGVAKSQVRLSNYHSHMLMKISPQLMHTHVHYLQKYPPTLFICLCNNT